MKTFFTITASVLFLLVSLPGCSSTDQSHSLTGSDDTVAEHEAMNDPYYPIDSGY